MVRQALQNNERTGGGGFWDVSAKAFLVYQHEQSQKLFTCILTACSMHLPDRVCRSLGGDAAAAYCCISDIHEIAQASGPLNGRVFSAIGRKTKRGKIDYMGSGSQQILHLIKCQR